MASNNKVQTPKGKSDTEKQLDKLSNLDTPLQEQGLETMPKVKEKPLTIKDVIAKARKLSEPLSDDEMEIVRLAGEKQLWQKHRYKFGEKESTFISLEPSEEKLCTRDENGRPIIGENWPHEYTCLNGVKVFIPKGITVRVPIDIKDIIENYVNNSTTRKGHKFVDLSAPQNLNLKF